MLDDRLPGIAEKRGEIAGWVEMAKRQGWYVPDDELDAHLPYLTRDCGWDDKTWRANEHSFDLLLEHVEPGMRVLEVGAAKGWAAQHLVPRGVEYVATDILADKNIGIGRGRSSSRGSARSRACRPTASTSRSRMARSTSPTASPRCTTRSTSRGWSARWRA